MSSHSVIQPTGNYGTSWPQNHNLPQGKEGSISLGGWTKDNEGFVQQTFLGASIRSFDLNAGFGDTTSSLSVSVVNDEYNKSDGEGYGAGDDVYHNGTHDDFKPPIVGSPVFFKFGKHTATIEQSWRLHFDDTYNIDSFPTVAPFPQVTSNGPITTVPNGYYLISKTGAGTALDPQVNLWEDQSALVNNLDHPLRGSGHFAFGGILQSYTENRGPGGNPLYNISVQDPREILSNATLILNNYAGTTHNNKNLFNVYGFLEHSKSRELTEVMDSLALEKVVLTRYDDHAPKIYYRGKDLMSGNVDTATPAIYPNKSDFYKFPVVSGVHIEASGLDLGSIEEFFPITGPGFSRRSEQGIPLYRVTQAVDTLFEYNGTLPEEYKNIGFGGEIDFRGYNYVVDFSGIPFNKIPALYYLDFNQIDLLSFVQELCEIISHDFFVSLLPVIDHPACSNLYAKNKYYASKGMYNKTITGIIRIDTIDKSKQPTYGAIKSYIDNLSLRDIHVENRDLGFEVSNVTTDKFVVGAQEVEMYYFNTEKDRDLLQKDYKDKGGDNYYEKLQNDQWKLGTCLQQQTLPFYGFIGDECPTIPLGFGSYQQIKLDASNLDAYGVGRYYVATEMELRAASVSYEQWRDFLRLYDEAYIQELGENQAFMVGVAGTAAGVIPGLNDPEVDDFPEIAELKNREFGVGVPRCVHISDLNGVKQVKKDGEVVGEYPLSPCAPPFGFPLYYKRAESIGIPQAGLADIQNSITRCVTNLEKLENSVDANRTFLQLNLKQFEEALAEMRLQLKDSNGTPEGTKIQEQITAIEKDIAKKKLYVEKKGPAAVLTLTSTLNNAKDLVKSMPRLARQYEKNAKKVYNFVKGVADKHLGTTFLVRIPKLCNVFHADKIELSDKTGKRKFSTKGPFGFKPRSQIRWPSSGWYADHENRKDIVSNLESLVDENNFETGPFQHYLNDDPAISGSDKHSYTNGALKNNYNTLSEKWDFNYKPEPQGGYLDEDKFKSEDFDFMLPSGYKNIERVWDDDTKEEMKLNGARVLSPFWGSFIERDGRISCYVRYDNSQYLSFDGVSSNEMVQQQVDGSTFFPDIMDEIDNVNPHQSETFDKIADRVTSDKDSDEDKTKKSVAYLKCEIDDKFYMIPKTINETWHTFADSFRFKPNFKSLGIVEEIGEDGCVTRKPARPYSSPIFNPVTEFGCSTSWGIETFVQDEEDWEEPSLSWQMRHTSHGGEEATIKWDYLREKKRLTTRTKRKEDLDPNHIYALVTLPVRVNPSVDQRYVDGPMMQFNAPQIRNALTADVNAFLPYFRCPAFRTNEGEGIDCSKLSFGAITNALRVQKSQYQKVSLALPEAGLSFVSPSPVYPDLFALPLMSMERCYGPWTSSFKRNGNPNFDSLGDYEQTHARYSNIGGKIEFEKDENLAPWNYAGYDLLANAAELKSNFSNSLLLFGERGGFVIPEAPTGISLAKALVNEGPLVTSISVSISNSIKTTIKMDLYTARFGKLHKQKEISVGKIVRETQKIKDEKNKAIRLGLRDEAIGKKSMTQYNAQGAKFSNAARISSEALSSIEKKQTSYSESVGTNERSVTKGVDLDGNEVEVVSWNESISIQSSDHLNDAVSSIPDDRVRNQKLQESYDGKLQVTGMNETPGANFNLAAPENINEEERLKAVFGTNYDEIGEA